MQNNAKWVYLAQGVKTNYWKIGISQNLDTRIKDLINGLPFNLIIMGAYQSLNARGEESYWLDVYSHYRTRGDWFKIAEQPVVDELLKKFRWRANQQNFDNALDKAHETINENDPDEEISNPEIEYIRSPTKPKFIELARKYNISNTALSKRRYREGWEVKRDEYWLKMKNREGKNG